MNIIILIIECQWIANSNKEIDDIYLEVARKEGTEDLVTNYVLRDGRLYLPLRKICETFGEEVVWDPYFQKDIQYHYDGIMDSLKRAAAKVGKVDAIGGSAAGGSYGPIGGFYIAQSSDRLSVYRNCQRIF